MVVVGKGCGRLPGIRLGRRRGVLVGLLGWVAGVRRRRGAELGVAAAGPALLARAARDLAGDAGPADLRSLEADMANELTQLSRAASTRN